MFASSAATPSAEKLLGCWHFIQTYLNLVDRCAFSSCFRSGLLQKSLKLIEKSYNNTHLLTKTHP
jgi:hypothetical protein